MSDLNVNIPFRPFHSSTYNFQNLTGRRFGKWIVISVHSRDSHRATLWLCRCDCGRWYVRNGSSLVKGSSSSCKHCVPHPSRPTHGETCNNSSSPEIRAYQNAMYRCQNPQHQAFNNYGGRGIKFQFTSFEEFLTDIGRCPTPKHSLDRIDNNGHYEIGNVRWATHSQQSHNRRTNRYLTLNGEQKTLVEWSRIYHINQCTLAYRLKKGWSLIKALTHPVHTKIIKCDKP